MARWTTGFEDNRPHAAQLGVKTDQAGNVGLVVLERINVALGGFLDEIPVKRLPAALLVKDPLGANLASVVQPGRHSARQAADSCSGEGRERGDDGGVHRLNPQPAAESGTNDFRTDYDCDADDRGPSDISRELRCPDR